MKSEKSVTWQLSEAKAAGRKGDIERARALYEKILAKYPKNKKAQAGLAALSADDHVEPWLARLYRKYNANQFSEVLDDLEGILASNPGHKAARDLKAACHRLLGQPEAALEIYRARLDEDPETPELWQKCGTTLVEMMRLLEAEECLVMATRLAPETVQNWQLLANCYQRKGDHEAAYDALTQALGREPDNSAALDQLGQVLRDMGRGELALTAHQRALDLAGTAAERATIHANIGVVLSSRGDKAGARQSYRAALKQNPEHVHALLNMVSVATDDDNAELQKQATKLVQKDWLSSHDRSQINFALFKLTDRAGQDPARAFDYLSEANELRRQMIRYNPDNQSALFRFLQRMSDAAPTLTATAQGPRPVFIVGLPRSGTTLTEQMLSAAPGTFAAGELTTVERTGFALMRQLETDKRTTPTEAEMQDFAANLRGEFHEIAKTAPVILDKMPLNFRWVGLILKALPDARVIHIRRDAIETCWSNYITSYSTNGNGFAYGLPDLAHYHALYDNLTAHWAAAFPDRMRTIHYEDLVETPEPVMRGLVDFAGLEWSDGCLHPETIDRAVLTASSHQVRREIYNGNRGKWRPYAPFIGPLLDALGEPHAA